MRRFYILLIVLVLSIGIQAQNNYKWEREHPGALLKPKADPVPGFKSTAIFEVLNQIPMLNKPKGFEVREGASARLDGKIYKGYLMVGLPLYYRWGTGPLEKQGEYYMTNIYINDREELRNIYSFLLSEETDKLNLPPIFTDTFAVSYQTINGYSVGVSRSRLNQNLYILNPRKRPCFIPATKEQFIKLWIGKLGLDIAKEKGNMEETKGYLQNMKGNAEVEASMRQTIKLSELWLDFLVEKKKRYEQKLASLTAAEKQAPAYCAMPKDMAVLQKKGVYVDKVTGDLPNELADGIDAESTSPVFQFNPDFFDPKLPKTAFQLIVIKDGFRQGWNEGELMPIVQEGFFPKIDFKQLEALMYK